MRIKEFLTIVEEKYNGERSVSAYCKKLFVVIAHLVLLIINLKHYVVL